MNDDLDGTDCEPALPPLESDNPEWVAARWRAAAAGARSPERPKPRGAEKALRRWLPETALVDVFCRSGSLPRLVLRVAVDDGRQTVRYDVRVLAGGHESSWIFRLTAAPVFKVPCRCGEAHLLSSLALARMARNRKPGKPRRCAVSDVAQARKG